MTKRVNTTRVNTAGKITAEYTKIRRIFWLSMGFCPECMGFNDIFPTTKCSECLSNRKIKGEMRKKYAITTLHRPLEEDGRSS